MAEAHGTAAVSANANSVTITHNLANAAAVVTKLTPNWPCSPYIVSKASNTTTVSWDVSPSAPSSLDWKVET